MAAATTQTQWTASNDRSIAADEVKRALDPLRSVHDQLAEEVESYERLKRGDIAVVVVGEPERPVRGPARVRRRCRAGWGVRRGPHSQA